MPITRSAIYKKLDGFAESIGQHPALSLLIHILICWGLAATGPNWLEPLVLNWFWGPILTGILMPRYSWEWGWSSGGLMERFTSWLVEYRREIFWASWFASVVVIPFKFWAFFRALDEEVAHAIRELIGNEVRQLIGVNRDGFLHGQNVFFLLVVGTLTILTVVTEWYHRMERNRAQSRSMRNTGLGPCYHGSLGERRK